MERKTPKTLKILSHNIHKGFSSGNREFMLHQVRNEIRRVHPDLVFLQEVLGQHEGHRARVREWPDQSQFEFLADEIWPHYAYGKNAVYSSGHHGNAILSKYPFVSWENIDISTNTVEKRGLLHGVIEVPGHASPLHAICVHLGLLEADRKKQVQWICDRIESHVPHGEPLLIAGDFNDWRMQITRTLQKELEVEEAFLSLANGHARTFPSWLPALKLDRIYFRGLSAVKARCLNESPWSGLSDHLALYVEMSF